MKTFSLSGNTLKIIAALSMLLDHMGVILFPDIYMLPAFAYVIPYGQGL